MFTQHKAASMYDSLEQLDFCFSGSVRIPALHCRGSVGRLSRQCGSAKGERLFD